MDWQIIVQTIYTNQARQVTIYNGIKLYQLCESASGYTYQFKVYTGKEGDRPDRNHTMTVVMNLIRPLLGRGHLLWMDNYYTGIPLLDELRGQNTLAAGTLRVRRQGVPRAIRDARLRKGEVVFRRRGDLLALKWRDKKDVAFLTNAHESTMADSRTRRDANGHPVQVPSVKLDYDKRMNGVDKNDQNVGAYAARRKSTKWYKKLVFHMFDLVRFQAYILYTKETDRPVSQLQFIQELIHCLVERADLPPANLGRPRQGMPLQRLTARHFPSFIPPTDRKAHATRRCRVCSVPTGRRRERGVPAPRRRETRYQCAVCGVALCIVPCFELYHTHTNYQQAYENLADDE